MGSMARREEAENFHIYLYAAGRYGTVACGDGYEKGEGEKEGGKERDCACCGLLKPQNHL